MFVNKIFSKFINSSLYIFLKNIFTLHGDKKLIVPALTFYILIGLIPLATLTFFFLKVFGFEENYLFEILKLFFPEIINTIKENVIVFEGKNVATIITSIISIYIASKGTLNYLFYLESKYDLGSFKYPFLTSRVYAIILTTLLSLSFAFINSVIIFLSQISSHFFKFLIYLITNSYIFLIILFFNYFLVKRKIQIKNLIVGSYLTSFLFSISRYILEYIITTASNKEKYYGFLTSFIVAILFLNLLVYFFTLGNELNFTLINYQKSNKRI